MARLVGADVRGAFWCPVLFAIALFASSGNEALAAVARGPAARSSWVRAGLRLSARKPNARSYANWLIGGAALTAAERGDFDPFTTGPDGLFGWEVMPGFSQLTAQDRGCTPGQHGKLARTRTLQLPPAALDVGLVLTCRHLDRATTSTTLSVSKGSGELVLVVHVRACSGPKPAGVVMFLTGRQAFAIVSTTPPADLATIAIPARRSSGLRVGYEVDGLVLPRAG